MEFFFAILFLLFYYIRPQDWLPGLEGAELVKPIIGAWLLVLVSSRSRPSPLTGIMRTPHDWIMVLYLGYIVVFADGAILAILPFLAFYMLTVQSVNSWSRLLTYLKYWNGALVTLAAIGVLSFYGIDPTGAQDLYYTEIGRLSIGTTMHNNPNALGHSIIVAIPLSFVLFFWKGNALSRFFVFPLIAATVFYCAWETQSKGAYLVGGGLLTLALVVGRPKFVQILAISAALIVGVSALSFLPRMSDMNNLRADEGVQGRLLAWEMARTAVERHETGVGWNKFIAHIPWKEGNRTLIVRMATHSSYVQVAADLGKWGLFLFLAVIWVSIHTLLRTKTKDVDEERCRRALMILVMSYVMSGWMINREYHTEYFLMIAVTAAMHRLRKGDELALENPQTTSVDTPPSSDLPEGSAPTEPLLAAVRTAAEKLEPLDFDPGATRGAGTRKPLWNRFGLFDLACSASLTWLTFQAWDYFMRSI
jgi:hypothetical protein